MSHQQVVELSLNIQKTFDGEVSATQVSSKVNRNIFYQAHLFSTSEHHLCFSRYKEALKTMGESRAETKQGVAPFSVISARIYNYFFVTNIIANFNVN